MINLKLLLQEFGEINNIFIIPFEREPPLVPDIVGYIEFGTVIEASNAYSTLKTRNSNYELRFPYPYLRQAKAYDQVYKEQTDLLKALNGECKLKIQIPITKYEKIKIDRFSKAVAKVLKAIIKGWKLV